MQYILFAHYKQPKYRDLSTNVTRRYWSWILLWQYYLSRPDNRYVFFSKYNAQNLVWNWYGSMEDCRPFHSWNSPFYSILASSIFHTEISVPFHFPFHSIPCPGCLFYIIIIFSVIFHPNGCSQVENPEAPDFEKIASASGSFSTLSLPSSLPTSFIKVLPLPLLPLPLPASASSSLTSSLTFLNFIFNIFNLIAVNASVWRRSSLQCRVYSYFEISSTRGDMTTC